MSLREKQHRYEEAVDLLRQLLGVLFRCCCHHIELAQLKGVAGELGMKLDWDGMTGSLPCSEDVLPLGHLNCPGMDLLAFSLGV